MRIRELSLGLLIALSSLTSGCVKHVYVKASVLYPAQVPVRAYPHLLIAGGTLPEGDLVARLAAHLRKAAEREVEVVEVEELEPRRERGEISPLSLTILIEPTLYSDVRQDWDMVPVQVCDFYWGCFTQYQPVDVTTPALVGEVTLTVYEGPTARVLQTERFEAVSFAADTPDARKRLIDQLGKQLERAVDVLQSTQRIELMPVKELPEIDAGLRAIRQGNWQQGRRLFEQAARALGGKSSSVQARVWYNVGMARWYAPDGGALTKSAFEHAQRALALAASLDERFRGAVPALQRARERQAVLEAQRSAAKHNFALAKELPLGPDQVAPPRAP